MCRVASFQGPCHFRVHKESDEKLGGAWNEAMCRVHAINFTKYCGSILSELLTTRYISIKIFSIYVTKSGSAFMFSHQIFMKKVPMLP